MPNKLELVGDYKMPTWTASYLETGDDEGVTDQDVENLAVFLKQNFYDHGYRNLVFNWGEVESFAISSFGLPGPSYNCQIVGHKVAL